MSFEINRYNNGGGGLARRTDSQMTQIDEAARLAIYQIETSRGVGSHAISELVIFHVATSIAASMAPSGTAAYEAVAQEVARQVGASLRQLGYRIHQ